MWRPCKERPVGEHTNMSPHEDVLCLPAGRTPRLWQKPRALRCFPGLASAEPAQPPLLPVHALCLLQASMQYPAQLASHPGAPAADHKFAVCLECV